MISTDFAPNERPQDAFVSLKLIFQPWIWKEGEGGQKIKRRLRNLFFPTSPTIFLHLTGRSALFHILKSLKLEKQSEILVQAFTCEAVVLPILENKLKPKYVDITASDFSIDLKDLKKKYSSECKVLILQHTFGITPNKRTEILAFAASKNLFVIEDVAHGFDPKLFQKEVTSSLLMSFGRSKSFSSVFGGAIITTDQKVIKHMRQLEKIIPTASTMFLLNMALYKPLAMFIKATYDIYIGKLIHLLIRGTNLLIPEISKKEKSGSYDMLFSKSYPNLAALLLLEQLRTFNDVSDRRKQVCAFYNNALELTNNWDTMPLIRYPYLSDNRDPIIKKLHKHNIILGTWYDQVVAPKEVSLKRLKYIKGTCPTAEKLCTQVINLPTNITLQQAKAIVTHIESV